MIAYNSYGIYVTRWRIRLPRWDWLLNLLADAHNAGHYSRTWWPYSGEPARGFGQRGWKPWVK